MRLIDADALMEYTQNQTLRSIECNDIARFPTIEAEPVKHGKWVCLEPVIGFFACSECDCRILKAITVPKECHNCGAKMDLEG